MQIRRAQEELAARLGPERLAFLQKRAASRRTAAAATAAPGGSTSKPQGPKALSGSAGRYQPIARATSQGGAEAKAAAPELSGQGCLEGPLDVRKLTEDAAKGALSRLKLPA